MGLLTASQVLRGALFTFGLAFFAAVPLIIIGGAPISILLALSIAMGYLYTGGPYPLAYLGLGDLFVLLFFGIAATGGMYYLLAHSWTLGVLIAGIQVGLLATVLIALNNLRDIQEDQRSGKLTLAVRLGKERMRFYIVAIATVPFLLNIYWLLVGEVYAALLPSLTLPIALLLLRAVWYTEPSSRFNQFLGMAALLHLSFGLLFSLGLVLK